MPIAKWLPVLPLASKIGRSIGPPDFKIRTARKPTTNKKHMVRTMKKAELTAAKQFKIEGRQQLYFGRSMLAELMFDNIFTFFNKACKRKF